MSSMAPSSSGATVTMPTSGRAAEISSRISAPEKFPSFCARLFGIRHYAAILGFLSMFFYIGVALGSVGYGVSRSATGHYGPALLGSALALGVSALLFVLLGRQHLERSAAAVR